MTARSPKDLGKPYFVRKYKSVQTRQNLLGALAREPEQWALNRAQTDVPAVEADAVDVTVITAEVAVTEEAFVAETLLFKRVTSDVEKVVKIVEEDGEAREGAVMAEKNEVEVCGGKNCLGQGGLELLLLVVVVKAVGAVVMVVVVVVPL